MTWLSVPDLFHKVVYVADEWTNRHTHPESYCFIDMCVCFHLHERLILSNLPIAAISNIIGKMATGWFTDMSCVDSFLVSNIYIFISGVSVCLLPFCNSFGMYGVVVSIYGFFTMFFTLEPIILVELFGIDNLTSAFGLLLLFQGIASIIGTPIAAAVYGAVGSYDVSFYIAGGFFILASLMSFVAQLLHKLKKPEINITQL